MSVVNRPNQPVEQYLKQAPHRSGEVHLVGWREAHQQHHMQGEAESRVAASLQQHARDALLPALDYLSSAKLKRDGSPASVRRVKDGPVVQSSRVVNGHMVVRLSDYLAIIWSVNVPILQTARQCE
eukprot:CAMPEP_0184383140 /NCGR_PEP_ID=MMETSP0007-20130409/6894_1 /TAXON_ID=97485 /ORGANISM="Prymnesium parvum, Strain Texoma1" /LENGTH=125 /DNA_ID=CAMNT_0026729481 /DNA_START=332 /DNA_END=711 /DNA_ORIENTATION=+